MLLRFRWFRRGKDAQVEAAFSPMAQVTGRVICAWSGVLPATPYCRHSLSIIDIQPNSFRARSGEPAPFRTALSSNVEIVLGFRYLFSPKNYWLLFRAQSDFRLPGRTIEDVAEAIGRVIARELKLATTAEKLIRYNDDWMLTVDAAYNIELKNALNKTGVHPVHFKNNPEFYRQQYLR